ncbi:hypothetical protein Tco_1342499, partial [Tanacetum coccineum]
RNTITASHSEIILCPSPSSATRVACFTEVEKTATNLHELVRLVSQLVRIVDSVAPHIYAGT